MASKRDLRRRLHDLGDHEFCKVEQVPVMAPGREFIAGPTTTEELAGGVVVTRRDFYDVTAIAGRQAGTREVHNP